MSELMSAQKLDAGLRHSLLMNVSILALAGAVCVPSGAMSADGGHPTIWIELGGQLERVDSPQTIFAPPFIDLASPGVLEPIVDAQRPSRYAIGAEGKISLMPNGTNWVLSAAIRYGRATNSRHKHYQTPGLPSFFNTYTNGARKTLVQPLLRQVGDGQTDFAESHFLLDFQAGKDVGLGLFGAGGNSVFGAGVRYAQFTSRSTATLRGRPILGYDVFRYQLLPGKYATRHKLNNHIYTATAHATRSTHAVGPSVSWDASMPLLGNDDGMSVVLDWGVNAAVLFGRQRTGEDHKTTGYHLYYIGKVQHTQSYAHAAANVRSHGVTIPNIGGFAGLSLKFPNARISLGYRGDFFFNATDSGLDARDPANQNFYGPFATISIGLGG